MKLKLIAVIFKLRYVSDYKYIKFTFTRLLLFLRIYEIIEGMDMHSFTLKFDLQYKAWTNCFTLLF